MTSSRDGAPISSSWTATRSPISPGRAASSGSGKRDICSRGTPTLRRPPSDGRRWRRAPEACPHAAVVDDDLDVIGPFADARPNEPVRFLGSRQHRRGRPWAPAPMPPGFVTPCPAENRSARAIARPSACSRRLAAAKPGGVLMLRPRERGGGAPRVCSARPDCRPEQRPSGKSPVMRFDADHTEMSGHTTCSGSGRAPEVGCAICTVLGPEPRSVELLRSPRRAHKQGMM